MMNSAQMGKPRTRGQRQSGRPQRCHLKGGLLQILAADAGTVAQHVQRRIKVRIAFIAEFIAHTPPQRRQTRQRLFGSQRNQRHRHAFKATAGLKIGIACLFPESGFFAYR